MNQDEGPLDLSKKQYSTQSLPDLVPCLPPHDPHPRIGQSAAFELPILQPPFTHLLRPPSTHLLQPTSTDLLQPSTSHHFDATSCPLSLQSTSSTPLYPPPPYPNVTPTTWEVSEETVRDKHDAKHNYWIHYQITKS